MEPQTGSKLQMEYSRLYIVTCLFNFSAEYIMRNAELEETLAGIKITGRNINNLRYVDDTIIMPEKEEELKSLLMVKEESENAGLKLIQKMKITASSPIISWEIDGETMETLTDFSWAPKSLWMVNSAMKLKDAYSLEEKLWNLDSIFKSRDITLSTKVRLVKAMVFPVVMYECESWPVKKAERQRIDVFELWF